MYIDFNQFNKKWRGFLLKIKYSELLSEKMLDKKHYKV